VSSCPWPGHRWRSPWWASPSPCWPTPCTSSIWPRPWRPVSPRINAFLANKWYLDAINDKLFVQGSRKLARSVLEVDSKVVDGVVNLTGLVTLGSGEGLKYFETGRAQFYALIVFGGVIALVVLFGSLG
jgi:NADH:ubiquinone oxidoreductase subunit 5 (subunit L)/multisubunit Na+/H+ antiporter MnhA subunit